MYSFSNDDEKRITKNTTSQQKKCTPCSSRNDIQSNTHNKNSFTNIEAKRPQNHSNINLSKPSFNLNLTESSTNTEAIRRPSNTSTQVRNPTHFISNMNKNYTDLDKMRFGNLSRQPLSKTCAPTSFKSESFPPQAQVIQPSFPPLALEGKISFPENNSPFQGDPKSNSRGSTNLVSFGNNMNLTSSTNLGRNSTSNPVSHKEEIRFPENIRPFQGNLEINNTGSSNLVSYGSSMNPLSIKMGRNSTSNPVCNRNNMNSSSTNIGRNSTSNPVCKENSINPRLTSNNLGFNGNKNPTVTFKCPDFDELIHAFSSSNQEINKSGKMQNNRGKTAFQIKKLKESDFDELMRTLAEDNYFSDTCSESSNYLYSETVKEEMKKLDKLELEFSRNNDEETTKVPEYNRGLDNQGEVTNFPQYDRKLNDNTFLVDDTKLNKTSVTKVPGYDGELNNSFSVINNSKVEDKITNNSLIGAGKAGKLSGDCCRNSAQKVLPRSQNRATSSLNIAPMSQTGVIMSQNRVTGSQDGVIRSQNGVRGSLNVAAMSQTGVIMSQNRVTGCQDEVIRSQNGVRGSLNVTPMSQTGVIMSQNRVTGCQDEVIRSQNGVRGSLNVTPMSQTGVIMSQNRVTGCQDEVIRSQNGVRGSLNVTPMSQTGVIMSQNRVTGSENEVTRSQNGVTRSLNVAPMSQTGVIMSQNRVTGCQDEVIRSQNGVRGSLNVTPMSQTGVMSQNRVTGSKTEVTGSQNGVRGSLNVTPMSQTGVMSQNRVTRSKNEVPRSQNRVTGSLNVTPMSQTGAFDTRIQNGVTMGQNGVEISHNVPPRSKDYDELIQAFTNEINGYNNQGNAKFSQSKTQFDEKGGKLRGSCCKISNEPKTSSVYDKLIEIFSSRPASDSKLNEKIPYQAKNGVKCSKAVLNPENLCIPDKSDVMKSLKAQQNNVESKVIVDQGSEGSYLSTSTTQNSEKSFDCSINELLRTYSGECNSDFNNMTIDDPRCQKSPSRKSLKSLRENRKETEKCGKVEENEEIKSDNLSRTKSEHVIVLLNQLAPTPLRLIPIKKKVNKEELPLMNEKIKCALKQIKEVDKKAGDLFLSLIGKERQCTNIRKQKRLQNYLRRMSRPTERNVTCQNQREKCRQEILNPNIQRSIMNSQRFLQRRAARKYSCKKDLPIDC